MKTDPLSEESGFTLAEMLVALAILALMSTYAIMSISTLSRAKNIEQRIDATAEVEAVQRHLLNVISDTRPIFALDAQSLAKLAFEGKADRLELVAPLNDRLERGGLYRLRYVFDASSGNLNFSYELFRPQPLQSSGSQEQLLTGLKRVSFRYFGYNTEDQSGAWTSAWDRTDTLPVAIEISADFAGGTSKTWTPLIIRVAGE
jgi:general secretion pathway protein J